MSRIGMFLAGALVLVASFQGGQYVKANAAYDPARLAAAADPVAGLMRTAGVSIEPTCSKPVGSRYFHIVWKREREERRLPLTDRGNVAVPPEVAKTLFTYYAQRRPLKEVLRLIDNRGERTDCRPARVCPKHKPEPSQPR